MTLDEYVEGKSQQAGFAVAWKAGEQPLHLTLNDFFVSRQLADQRRALLFSRASELSSLNSSLSEAAQAIDEFRD